MAGNLCCGLKVNNKDDKNRSRMEEKPTPLVEGGVTKARTLPERTTLGTRSQDHPPDPKAEAESGTTKFKHWDMENPRR